MKEKKPAGPSKQTAKATPLAQENQAFPAGVFAESALPRRPWRKRRALWALGLALIGVLAVIGILLGRRTNWKEIPCNESDCFPYLAAPTYPSTGRDIVPFTILEEAIENISIPPGASPNPPSDEQASFRPPEPPSVIDHPFLEDIRYAKGRFYACVVTGYDPSYTHSDCGGYHAQDAWVKVWYEVDVPNGRLSPSPEPDEPGDFRSCYLFDGGNASA